MYKRKTSKSTLFLMEMIIVVLIFALCAAVCLHLFAASQKMTEESEQLNRAVTVTKTMAGYYKATDGSLYLMQELLEGPAQLLEHDAVELVVYYDDAWAPVEKPVDKGFCLRVKSLTAPNASLQEAEIGVSRMDETQIFQIVVKKAATGGERDAS